jgi:endo-1,4-beta-xylanase
VDAIGLQSHMHQGYWGEEKTLRSSTASRGTACHCTSPRPPFSGHVMPPEIEDLNDFQPPEWPSTPPGEERQAEEIVRHYRTLLSHPSVQAVNYWGMTDAGAWLGAPSGLIRADGTAKPAYEYDSLRARSRRSSGWHPPPSGRTQRHASVCRDGQALTWS